MGYRSDGVLEPPVPGPASRTPPSLHYPVQRLQLRLMIEGEAQQAVTAAELQFLGDVLPVGFHGADTALK